MSTLSLRERRRQQAIKDLTRLEATRDTLLDKLSRTQRTLKATRKAIERYERPLPPPAVKPVPAARVEPPVPHVTTPVAAPPAPESLDTSIPDFLKRKREGEARDKAAADAIRAEQAESKRTKTHARLEKMKAAKRGETRKMPLSGKAALAAIMQDD
jgi:hypothetical protein